MEACACASVKLSMFQRPHFSIEYQESRVLGADTLIDANAAHNDYNQDKVFGVLPSRRTLGLTLAVSDND